MTEERKTKIMLGALADLFERDVEIIKEGAKDAARAGDMEKSQAYDKVADDLGIAAQELRLDASQEGSE